MKSDLFDVTRNLIDPRNKNVSLSQAEKFTHGEAKSGNNPMAEFIWGKMLGNPEGVQKNQMSKFWTSSALKGNAYAQVGLTGLHRKAGYLPVAIQWYERAFVTAAIPEAAYYLALAYGKRELPEYPADAGLPIQYEKAARYYVSSSSIFIYAHSNVFT